MTIGASVRCLIGGPNSLLHSRRDGYTAAQAAPLHISSGASPAKYATASLGLANAGGLVVGGRLDMTPILQSTPLSKSLPDPSPRE